MKYVSILAGSILLLLVIINFTPPVNKTSTDLPIVTELDSSFKDYWYQGTAEVSTYELSQNRYKDLHPGEAVLIQVTEDFLTDKQVKNDNYKNPNSASVLKTNLIRRFTTGIYDYSTMLSVFTPVETAQHPLTEKVTFSSQDWCGHSFLQLNKTADSYKVQSLSYFENEGDQDEIIGQALLEDELFNRIRMNPKSLPIGDIDIIPSSISSRMMHKKIHPVSASSSLEKYNMDDMPGESLMSYKVDFKDGSRRLEIIFEENFPYKIAGWKETSYSMFDKKQGTTIARLKGRNLTSYWQENSNSFSKDRASLGLGNY